MKLIENIDKKPEGYEHIDLISGEEIIDDDFQYSSTPCYFCGNDESKRFVKRVWSGDHNEWPCICENCIEKFSKTLKSV